jgi:hypothetical protein
MGQKRAHPGTAAAGAPSGKTQAENARRQCAGLLPAHILPETAGQLQLLLHRAAISQHRLFGTIIKGLCTSWHFSYALLLLFLRISNQQAVVVDDLNR